jgi:hypothetical protein
MKGGSEDVRLVQAARCAVRRAGLARPPLCAASRAGRRARGQRAACGAGRCHTCDAARGSPRCPPRPSSCVECQRARPSPLTAEPATCTTLPTSSDHKLKGGMPHFLPPNEKAESQVCRHPAAREQKVTRPTPWSLFWLSACSCLRTRLIKTARARHSRCPSAALGESWALILK